MANIVLEKSEEHVNPYFHLDQNVGGASRIITKTIAGIVINYDNFEKIYDSILGFYNSWKRSSLDKYTIINKVMSYSRKNLTEKIFVEDSI
tara:strand:- start:1211 stop:1483 length:273 start_codon:yes stop_codon:yes gene_type:complete